MLLLLKRSDRGAVNVKKRILVPDKSSEMNSVLTYTMGSSRQDCAWARWGSHDLPSMIHLQCYTPHTWSEASELEYGPGESGTNDQCADGSESSAAAPWPIASGRVKVLPSPRWI